jgi:hypothetical protein
MDRGWGNCWWVCLVSLVLPHLEQMNTLEGGDADYVLQITTSPVIYGLLL